MNQTIEDSKAIIVGGNTIAQEDGELMMPPKGKGTIDTTRIVEDILENEFSGQLKVIDNDKEHEDIMKKLNGYKENRKARRTETAAKREKEERENQAR